MKIQSMTARNYRTLESVTLSFPSYYCAISGKNDSGKTNVLRVLRGLFKYQQVTFVRFVFDDGRPFSIKDDFTRWIAKDGSLKSIELQVELQVFRQSDEGLYQFLVDYLSLKDQQDVLAVKMALKITENSREGIPQISVNGTECDSTKAQEVLEKFQSSTTILFHNSTGTELPFFVGRRAALLEIGKDERERLAAATTKLNAALATIAKHHQKDIGELLGRLQDKHKLGFSISKFDPEEFPYSVTLGEGEIPIESWGSGTQNRTHILMTLFKAKCIAETPTSPSKITPVIVIEEPESFLHPSAQGEFGRLLQELSEEFKVQVIVATHSPYMLSMDSQQSNILLDRVMDKGRLRATRVVDTSGDKWMEPFALSLGLDNQHFNPWKDALFNKAEEILLVEGETDKAYFDMLRDDAHGSAKLEFDGLIFPYNGRDSLRNPALLRLIKSRYKRFIITYDLDSDKELSKLLDGMGFERGKHYFPIGLSGAPGRNNIEGLLPEVILQTVYSRETALVTMLSSGDSDQRKSAKARLKCALLTEFQRTATPGAQCFEHFYGVVRKLNRALRGSQA
jgi:putative ATP-dependent endonuclease of OLD family